MSNDNWFGAEPPRDANGKVIPLDTEVLYDKYENVFHVVDFRYSPKEREWLASGGFTGPKDSWCLDTNRLLLAPPDSWEKLEEDAMKTTCNYALAPRYEDGLTTCKGCRFQKNESCHHEMTIDVFKRAKKLAGIEEQEGDA